MKKIYDQNRSASRRIAGTVVVASWIVLSIPATMLIAAPHSLPVDEKLTGRLMELTNDTFRIRESDHFTICYDTQYATIRSFIGRLEGTYDSIERFCKTLKWANGSTSQRMGVILFSQFEDFSKYATAEGLSAGTLAGYYSQQTNLSAFCDTLSSPNMKGILQQIERGEKRLQQMNRRSSGRRGGRVGMDMLMQQLMSWRLQRDAIVKRFNRFVIQHEAAHQMLFNTGVHARGKYNPYWVVEGLACQFETAQSDPKGRLKRTNHMRLADFHAALGVEVQAKRISAADYNQAVKSQRWIPLKEFVGDTELFSKRDKNITFRYAQAWALVFYLHREHPDTFSEYLHSIDTSQVVHLPRREQLLTAFERHFGKIDQDMEAAWINAMLKLRLDLTKAGLE